MSANTVFRAVVATVFLSALVPQSHAVLKASSCGTPPNISWPPTYEMCVNYFNYCMCDCGEQGPNCCWCACRSENEALGCEGLYP